MGRTFREQMRQDAERLLDSGEHEQTIKRYPLDNRNAGYELSAYVLMDHEEGTNELSGDGAVTRDEHGDRERRSGRIELSADEPTDDRDSWLIDGELWFTQRHAGRDAALQAILITREDPRHTRQPRLRSLRGGRSS